MRITKAAKAAQKNRRAFWELIRKYKIEVHVYKTRPLQNLDNPTHSYDKFILPMEKTHSR